MVFANKYIKKYSKKEKERSNGNAANKQRDIAKRENNWKEEIEGEDTRAIKGK